MRFTMFKFDDLHRRSLCIKLLSTPPQETCKSSAIIIELALAILQLASSQAKPFPTKYLPPAADSKQNDFIQISLVNRYCHRAYVYVPGCRDRPVVGGFPETQ